MTGLPLHRVSHLSLREIAEIWAPEAQRPESFLLRELQTAVVNLQRLDKGEPLLDVPLSDDELPDPDQRVDRAWLVEFCSKQEWNTPEFWFGEKRHKGPSFPGRPSKMAAIVQELRRRADAGELEATLAAEARHLSKWAAERFPEEQTPKPRSTETGIRKDFWKLKQARR